MPGTVTFFNSLTSPDSGVLPPLLGQGFLVYPKSLKSTPILAILRNIVIPPKKARMACMYLTMFESVEKAASEGLVIDADSLYSTFEQVTDGRKKRGKRYPLPLLLTPC